MVIHSRRRFDFLSRWSVPLTLTLILVVGCGPGDKRDAASDAASDAAAQVPSPETTTPPRGAEVPPPAAEHDEADSAQEAIPIPAAAAAVPPAESQVGQADLPVPSGPPEHWRDWESPAAVLVVSGQQYGYIEPCGCTGLENQKGGLMRRGTLLKELRERGWEVVPLDAGNQIRRTGRQQGIKFQTAIKGLQQLDYETIGFGADDLRLGASELLSVAADDGENSSGFASANVELLAPDLIPRFRQLNRGGLQIGVTTALDPTTVLTQIDEAIVIGDLQSTLAETLAKMQQGGCTWKILLLFGSEEAAKKIAREVPGFDFIIAAATVGEPLYQAELVPGTSTRVIKTGDKGMYVGVIGLFPDGPPRYSRQPMDAQFEDAPEILKLMAEYQDQLRVLGLDGLQVQPLAHPSGGQFVGTAKCGECHTTAHAIWEGTPHAEATEDLVHPGERSEIARHFDPECLSCHVTGWNPQGYYPYTSGYLSLELTAAMTGNGCENCHGPGKEHVDAEESPEQWTAAQLQEIRERVTLPLEKARERCLECHDLDNSPDFHQEGAFERYWAEVEHSGVD